MGNNGSNPIRNMDKRTARRFYRGDFMNAIENYRYERDKVRNNNNNDDDVDKEEEVRAGNVLDLKSGSFNSNLLKICARKRPIFDEELKLGEFDTITAIDNNFITIHDARMHSDMVRQLMNHHEFEFNKVYDENAQNQHVYSETIYPLLEYAMEGGFSTAMVYGQTGSGKTFTMTSMCNQAAHDIFQLLPEGYIVKLQYLEIVGDQIFDLLNSYALVQLLTACDGCVHPHPMVEPQASNEEELLALIRHGQLVRSSAATGVHDNSSRSHSILRIFMHKDRNTNNEEYNPQSFVFEEGVLTLVDLAGSEHRIDSMYHSAERRKEGAMINSSLMALKQCIHARAAGNEHAHIHEYRKSKLTMALKASLTLPRARTVVIATLSPASKDTEHSLNTLRHACVMGVQPKSHSQSQSQFDDNSQQPGQSQGETRFITGGNVTSVMIGRVDPSKYAGVHREDPTSNGNDHRNMHKTKGGKPPSTFGSNVQADVELSDKEKAAMRRKRERAAMSKLKEEYPEGARTLLRARAQLGIDKWQNMRLRAPPPMITQEAMQIEKDNDITNRDGDPSIQSPSTEERQRAYRISLKMQRLRAAVYSGDDTTPDDVKRRQYLSLLNMHGLKPDDEEEMMHSKKYHGRSKNGDYDPDTPCAVNQSGYNGVYNTPVSNSGNDSDNDSYRIQHNHSPDADAKPVHVPSRHEQVRLRREALIREESARRAAKLGISPTVPPPSHSDGGNFASNYIQQQSVVSNEEMRVQEQIQKLETALAAESISAATKSGLQRRLATQKSVLLREQRKRAKEMKNIEAEKEALQELAREKADAARKAAEAARVNAPAMTMNRVDKVNIHANPPLNGQGDKRNVRNNSRPRQQQLQQQQYSPGTHASPNSNHRHSPRYSPSNGNDYINNSNHNLNGHNGSRSQQGAMRGESKYFRTSSAGNASNFPTSHDHSMSASSSSSSVSIGNGSGAVVPRRRSKLNYNGVGNTVPVGVPRGDISNNNSSSSLNSHGGPSQISHPLQQSQSHQKQSRPRPRPRQNKPDWDDSFASTEEDQNNNDNNNGNYHNQGGMSLNGRVRKTKSVAIEDRPAWNSNFIDDNINTVQQQQQNVIVTETPAGDVLDPLLQQRHHQQLQQQQQQQRMSYTITSPVGRAVHGRPSLGASSAPFANDFNMEVSANVTNVE